MNYTKFKIAILCTCFNRADKTFNCISKLNDEIIKNKEKVDIKCFVVDDNSTDNTIERISSLDAEVYKTTGNYYWAKSMVYGESLIRKSLYNPDFLLVVNDDTDFISGFLDHLIKTWEANAKGTGIDLVIVGKILNPDTKEMTYGGRMSKSFLFPKSTDLASNSSEKLFVDTLNMNCALIPYTVINKIGFLSNVYQHAFADWDYGFKCQKWGIPIIQAPIAVGYCKHNSEKGTSKEKKSKISTKFKRILSIKEQPLKKRWNYAISSHRYAVIQTLLTPYVKLIAMHIKEAIF